MIDWLSKMIVSRELRAARALLGWSQLDLAEAASVGVATVRRLETAGPRIKGNVETVWKIQRALENAGIEFLQPEPGRGPGVRLKHIPPSTPTNE
jgi:transcriptional regulator with XRE-family HTH domain